MSRGCPIIDMSGFRDLNNAITDITLSFFMSLDPPFLCTVMFLGKLSPHGWGIGQQQLSVYMILIVCSPRERKKLFTLVVYISTLRGDFDCSNLLQASISELIMVARYMG